ncbi:hypothetical protein DUI87_22251 [Hirundo rustica rustica]|uniref:Uncharacterized protein n=1 Tax=Hirundo rustica rustica TaxID=333673 RepID=A0A3M0JQY5_HIRRU|nr:hypothetical protein DUI87_22251 [Hirundo rustica rustica]
MEDGPDEKKAQDSWSSSQRGSSNKSYGKDEHSQQVTVTDELYFKKIYKEVQTKIRPRGTHIICVFKAQTRKAKAQLELKLVRDVKGKDKGIYKYTSCKIKPEVNGKHCSVGQETVTNLGNSKITCGYTPISFVEDFSQNAQVPAASGNVTEETEHSPILISL